MRFYFIRHAQSVDNLYVSENTDRGVRNTGLDQSWDGRQPDPELSELGLKQAKLLGRFLASKNARPAVTPGINRSPVDEFDFSHVYSSLMVRSMETAGAVARALDLTPAIWEDLHETGGIWEVDRASGRLEGRPGKNREYFEKRYPDFKLPDRLGEEGWWNRPLETGAECKARAARFCAELIEKHGDTDDRIAVVGHGLFYSFMLNVLLKIPAGSGIRFVLNNTALTRIDFQDGAVNLVYQNRVDFLPADLIT